ncbi:MAG TPA: nitrilase-related carbon-nitrogen hydrolase [Isosphaeraceae bacterium]|nr:nitrilase-related carbon-nitrogen hydrolase [Isosphaeraceae bacterium]
MTVVRASVVQAASVAFDRDRTLERVHALATEAAARGAQLIVFPEALSATGDSTAGRGSTAAPAPAPTSGTTPRPSPGTSDCDRPARPAHDGPRPRARGRRDAQGDVRIEAQSPGP